MVNSVSQSQIPQSQPKTTKVSIFYVNDEHSNVPNMERLKTASDEFDSFASSEHVDKLKFSAGDFCIGSNKTLNELAVNAQNSMGIMATAGGNHEFDLLKKDLVDVLANNNYKLLGLNIEIPETTEENKKLRQEVAKSYIQEQNGTKYGVIGLFPFDFMGHVTNPKEYHDFKPLSIEKTVPLLQEEIDKIKAQGVNKIIVLSHAGYYIDVHLAKSVEGIDVIIGGHTHNLIEGIKEGKNLFYSKKTGEPTIITQAGKDGKYFGVINLEFNENGVITTAQNNVSKTVNFNRSPIMKYLTDKFLGKPQAVGVINSAPIKVFTLVEENPSAGFVEDAIKNELGVDVAIMNSANMRENFKKGPITDRDISELTPFKNKMGIVKLSEKELVDAIKVGAKSLTDKDTMPGLLQVSGLRYTVTKSGEVKEVSFIDKEGKENQIDINNPNTFKTYRVGTDVFVAMGGNGYISDKWDSAEAQFDFDKDKLVMDYIKRLNRPIDIKTDGRILVVES